MSNQPLTDFLLARIAEDEAQLPEWFVGTAAEWLPIDRIKAECEAKRLVVALHQCIDDSSAYAGVPLYCDPCQTVDGYGAESIGDRGTWPCDTLKALAVPYADHPDYRQEWKP